MDFFLFFADCFLRLQPPPSTSRSRGSTCILLFPMSLLVPWARPFSHSTSQSHTRSPPLFITWDEAYRSFRRVIAIVCDAHGVAAVGKDVPARAASPSLIPMVPLSYVPRQVAVYHNASSPSAIIGLCLPPVVQRVSTFCCAIVF